MDESCYYFISSLVVEKIIIYSLYENKILLLNFKKRRLILRNVLILRIKICRCNSGVYFLKEESNILKSFLF